MSDLLTLLQCHIAVASKEEMYRDAQVGYGPVPAEILKACFENTACKNSSISCRNIYV